MDQRHQPDEVKIKKLSSLQNILSQLLVILSQKARGGENEEIRYKSPQPQFRGTSVMSFTYLLLTHS